MNVTCPRCGTLILASHDSRRFKCPTCQVRYCHHCQSWKERGQKYCLECGLYFLTPPRVIHPSVLRSAAIALLAVILLSLFYADKAAWYSVVQAMVLLGLYFGVYLVQFQRRTLLTWAARREAVALARHGVIWSSLAYFAIQRASGNALIVLVIATVIATALGLFIINRLNPRVIDELRANRPVWKTILTMKAMQALLLRFPSANV